MSTEKSRRWIQQKKLAKKLSVNCNFFIIVTSFVSCSVSSLFHLLFHVMFHLLFHVKFHLLFHVMFHLCFISSGNCFMICFIQSFISSGNCFMLCFMRSFMFRGNCFILTKFSLILLVVSSQRRTFCLKNLGRGKNFSVLGGTMGEKKKERGKKRS